MTRAEWLKTAAARLTKAGVDDAPREAKLLLGAALNLDLAALAAGNEKTITNDEEKRADFWLMRREKREPLGRIRGAREFWKSSFMLNEATLEPRADSETIIEAALEIFKDNSPRHVLDLGTGTGCLLLSLLQEFASADGVGTDKSPRAQDAARRNARALGLEDRASFLCTSWADGIVKTFDLIVSNPPYIESAVIKDLQPEVKNHDPALALDGGADGLTAYRAIAKALPRVLEQGGVVIMEIGQGQERDVTDIFNGAGLKLTGQRNDLGGITRALIFSRA